MTVKSFIVSTCCGIGMGFMIGVIFACCGIFSQPLPEKGGLETLFIIPFLILDSIVSSILGIHGLAMVGGIVGFFTEVYYTMKRIYA
jgi:hypothetical protein